MINQNSYLELLSEHLDDCFTLCQIPLTTGTFMQDVTSCHTANLIKQWFEWVGIDYIKDWPGNSPDLITIENLWSIIKARLKDCDTSSVPKLEAAVKDIWNDIGNNEMHIIQNMALSVPDCLTEVISRKGRSTNY